MIPEEECKSGLAENSKEAHPPTQKKRGFFFKFFCLMFLLSIPCAWLAWKRLHSGFLEENPPSITLLKTPPGIGKSLSEINFEVEDLESGLDYVVVRYKQGGVVKDLENFTISKSDSRERQKMNIEIAGKKLGLREGDIEIIITAFDRSLLGAAATKKLSLKVDFKAPKVRVVSTQHNATLGGVQLVVYRVENGREKFAGTSGVKIGDNYFLGFPGHLLDSDFEGLDDIYFAFFPVPIGLDYSDTKIKLFAKDEAGNMGRGSIHYRIRNVRQAKRKYKISQDLLQSQLPNIYKQYLESDPQQGFSEAKSLAENVERYKILNLDFRKELEKQFLSKLFEAPKKEKLWKDTFAKYPGGTFTYNFGDIQTYSLEGEDGGTITSGGSGLRFNNSKEIHAANDGIVISSDKLGVFGQTVILDHGFGLTTLYANLGSRSVKVGETVVKGATLGVVGGTGLYLNNVLHYEVRMHGVPVRPEEWWDERWLKGHIDKKIEDAKKDLGIFSEDEPGFGY